MKRHARAFVIGCVMVLVAAAPGTPQQGAADADDWLVTWYLSREFGSGQTMFIIPDGSGGIWTNSAGYYVSRLWHISGDDVTPRFTVGCPEEWAEEPLGRVQLGGEQVATAERPEPAERPRTLQGPEDTRWRGIRGILDAARMPDGRLWIGTADGLIEIDEGETTFHARVLPVQGYGPSLFNYGPGSPPVSSVPTTALCVDGYGELWAYGRSMGLIRRTNAGGEKYPKYGVWTRYLPYYPGLTGEAQRLDDLLEGEVVTVIRSPAAGEVLLGTESGQLLALEQKRDGQGTSVALRERIASGAIGGAGPVTDIMRDSQGRLWCTHRGGKTDDGHFGGSVAMLENGKWRVWHCGNSNLPCRAVATVCEVRPGQVWIGVDWDDPFTAAGGTTAETGLFELAGDDWVTVNPSSYWAERYKVMGVEPKYWRQNITNKCTRGLSLIRVDGRGRVWVGSEGGLACFERAPGG